MGPEVGVSLHTPWFDRRLFALVTLLGRTRTVDEPAYWRCLEFRLYREFAGLQGRRHQYLWCDGLQPVAYLLDEARPRITGLAWIGDGSRQAAWEFTLLLPCPTPSREAIDWAALLPPEDMTEWMAFDEAGRWIEMEPAVAVPELLPDVSNLPARGEVVSGIVVDGVLMKPARDLACG